MAAFQAKKEKIMMNTVVTKLALAISTRLFLLGSLMLFGGINCGENGLEEPEMSGMLVFGGGNLDEANSVNVTPDDDLVVLGTSSSVTGAKKCKTMSFGEVPCPDFWVFRLDPQGNTKWEYHIGASGEEVSKSMASSAVGEIFLAGYSESFSEGDFLGEPSSKLWIVKLDANGSLLWQKAYGPGIGRWECTGIISTSDGGLAVTLIELSDDPDLPSSSLLKLNGNGDVQWHNYYQSADGIDDFYANAVSSVANGDFLVSGFVFTSLPDGNIGRIATTMKVDAEGKTIWAKKYFDGEASDVSDVSDITDIVTTADGGFAFSGWIMRPNPEGNYSEHVWVLKADSDGEIEWQKMYGDKVEQGNAYSIVQTEQGEFAVCGYRAMDGKENADIWVMKIDRDGELIWQRIYGGEEPDFGFRIQANSDGFVVAGTTESFGARGGADALVMKLDDDGRVIGEKCNASSPSNAKPTPTSVTTQNISLSVLTRAVEVMDTDALIEPIDLTDNLQVCQ